MTSQRVLVVEDNPDTARTLRLLLSLNGYEVQVATTGPEGVTVAQQWDPEVVLCDIGLPGLDGFGVASELRRTGVAARLVAVTAYGDDETRLRAIESGFDFFITKPADPAILLLVLPGKTSRE